MTVVRDGLWALVALGLHVGIAAYLIARRVCRG